jgi:ribonucleoside-triphosphate reductase
MFDTDIQEFVFYDKYSRFNRELGRRETWGETVTRVVDFLRELSGDKLGADVYQAIYDAIFDGHVSPSMRLMATAGKAARRNHLLLYNCAYTPIADIRAFSEILWLSMSGIGVGYSVERQYVGQLPVITPQIEEFHINHTIDDSAEGWVVAYNLGIWTWWNGGDVTFDYSEIRPEGTPLKTKGGTASGPGVLIDLMQRTRQAILARQGERLTPIEVFDIVTTIGNCAVSGGVRRSAQLTMFDFDDEEMLGAKEGEFWKTHPYRSNANISAVWPGGLTRQQIEKHMNVMFDNMTGEPGIVSRAAMNHTRPNRRRELVHGGLNPCAEINLHGATVDGRFGGQLCNLSSVNLRSDMDVDDIVRYAQIASVIGTIQASATDFRLLRDEWKEICEEERLVGVSLVGFSDSAVVRDKFVLDLVKTYVIMANEDVARVLGINPSPATTCVKPAGNSSVLYGVSRGVNPRFSDYYIRRVRVGTHTPVYRVLEASGVPMTPENGQEGWVQPSTHVVSFYEKSPDGAITIDDVTALGQLNNWLFVKQNWTEHNPSVTIEYDEDEREAIIEWVYENQRWLNGISLLPRSDAVYKQPPYEKITEEEYYAAIAAQGYTIDWSLLSEFETEDQTQFELECAGGVCDLR